MSGIWPAWALAFIAPPKSAPPPKVSTATVTPGWAAEYVAA